MRSENQEATTEEGAGKLDDKSISSDTSDDRITSPDVAESGVRNGNGSTAASWSAHEKLANAERKLARDMMLKKEKKQRYKIIIEENEGQLEALSKQMQDVEEDIKNKEVKITEMRRERKEMPFLKKFGSQFNIAKSVLKKERLEDDLSVLKNQSNSRKRIIQKYKTKIRYDLQILNDPSITTIKPSQEKLAKPKHAPRPIPQCFFVDVPEHQSGQHDAVPEAFLSKRPSRANQSSAAGESSLWSLSSVDDEANSMLVRRIENERDSDCGPLFFPRDKSCASSEPGKGRGLSSNNAV